MLHYLNEETARLRLIGTGLYTAETVPPASVLTLTLQTLEAYLHGWLGYCPAPKDYTDILHTNTSGHVILPEYPVISVNAVEPVPPFSSSADANNPRVFSYTIGAQWEGNSTIIFSDFKGTVRVQYKAGYSPLPEIFEITIFQALRKALEQQEVPGDLSFLNNPSRDTQSLSIPAVSKSWRISQPKIAGETEGDRLFSSLSEYRRHYRF